jgi:hypothetical protein
MRKFILHTLLFLIPVVGVAMVLLFSPTDKKRAYHYLTNDCEGRGAWLYRRIFESNQPIDLAFLGSSHTINGINDTLINNELAKDQRALQTVNLGYCRLGRDLTYVLMQHVLTQKNTRNFIIEVLPDENPFSHPVFPFLAEMKDVVTPHTLLNRSYAPNVYSAAVSRLMYFRQNLWNEPYAYTYGLRENFGFSTNTFTADPKLLDEKKSRRYKNRYKSFTWTRQFSLAFPRVWLQRIHQLAQDNGVHYVFLYIPPYGSPEHQPIEMNTYAKYAPVWVAPDSIFNNLNNWYDDEHLNANGAQSLSTWVARKIKKTDFR